ncbi:MAG: DUF5686 family protein, partial [Siphonobacter sp.]
HSLSFSFSDDAGVNYEIRQLYSPFQDVWMPVQLETAAHISIMGAKANVRYITSVRNYQVKVNPKYHHTPQVVDEKIDKEMAASLQKNKVSAQLPKQATRKQLKNLVKEMEKEDRKERKKHGEPTDVVQNWSYEIDTLARKRSTDFWQTERQVPLTKLETQGYIRADSLYKTKEAAFKKDSINRLPAFKWTHLLSGHTYNYGQRKEREWYPRTLTFESPVADLAKLEFFNAVEGFVLKSKLEYTQRIATGRSWFVGLNARYSFARERLNGGITLGKTTENTKLQFAAGRNVFQFNIQNPIPENVNTLYALFHTKNYMKLYEMAYITGGISQKINSRLSVALDGNWQERYHLSNHETRGWLANKTSEFTSNDPENSEMSNTAFSTHQAKLVTASLIYRPFAKTRIINGRQLTSHNNSPIVRGIGHMGWAGSKAFSQVELSITDELKLLRNDFNYAVKVGDFLKRPLYFMDYRHFNGNQTIFQTPVIDRFRLLNYYQYSTTSRYLEAHAENTFRRFLLTQLSPLRMYGLKESLFVHYLNTKEAGYVEIGYGLGGIFRILGIEIINSFQNGSYQATGFRIRTLL